MRLRNKFLLLVLSFVFLACGNDTHSGVEVNASAAFKVLGNCEMCKETIESSLKVDGIKMADWNKDTKMMNVVFDSTKITLDQIKKNVAAVGYDTENYRGDDKAYAGLPECCQYTRKE
jgi:periplasmic mercuric ion binding protein